MLVDTQRTASGQSAEFGFTGHFPCSWRGIKLRCVDVLHWEGGGGVVRLCIQFLILSLMLRVSAARGHWQTLC